MSASYSNFGGIDLVAPGGEVLWDTRILSSIVTNFPTALGPYDFKSGTSMASPCVAGTAALVLSMNPSLIQDDGTKHLLYRMALDLGLPGKDKIFGRGRLNLSRGFLQALRNASAFVGSPGTGSANGQYEHPYTSIAQALQSTSAGATLILNGGLSDQAAYSYPPITITNPVTLGAFPDKPVYIGQ
jgi:subtilisin family serine protease